MGLLAESGETPFVGNLTFFAGPSGDSTTVLLTVALANRVLTFGREGDRYRAAYNVALEVRRGTQLVRDFKSSESVRVLAFRETTRSDESVIFRHVLSLAPGTYEMRLTVRDESAPRGSAIEATVGIPRFGEGSISSPVAFYEAVVRQSRDSFPAVVATPRTTVTFGRDSILPFYVEGYGGGADFPIRVTVKGEGSTGVLYSEDVTLPRQRGLFAGTFNIPLARLGVGVMTVGVSRPGSADTLRSPVFVGFGEDLPVATFTEMLEYLRYYVVPSRLQAMRDASPDARAGLWAAFLHDTDPVPQTPQHEGLRDYFGRIAQANIRFREEGMPGWMTDRGRVFVALGTPDQIYEPNMADLNQRGRTQVWDYRSQRLQVVFIDQTGFGRWKMTMSSETEFESAARRVLVG
ncbi:MAG: GWxTD domain-containing protein [Gemmatimonadaceae bacterium]